MSFWLKRLASWTGYWANTQTLLLLPNLDSNALATAALIYYRLATSVTVWSNLPDKVSIGTLSRGGRIVNFDIMLSHCNKCLSCRSIITRTNKRNNNMR
jgi:hypothetical protein